MTISISLEGIQSVEPPETRALAHLKVILNDTEYQWKAYVPVNTTNLEQFLVDIAPKIELEILDKEAQWAALDPKTKIIPGIFLGMEDRIIDIDKSEIVRPDIPDYYATRRQQYPALPDQLEALWKGPTSTEYTQVYNSILNVRNSNPKKYMTPAEAQQELINTITTLTQKRLDDFAKTRNYDNILSACSYVASPVDKFRIEAEYCVSARALTWARLYEIMGEVQQGIRNMPSSYADIESELPALIWPE